MQFVAEIKSDESIDVMTVLWHKEDAVWFTNLLKVDEDENMMLIAS